MRKTVTFILDLRGTIHFCSDVNNIKREWDLWLMPERNKTLFENIEQILTRIGEAHNVTNIEQVTDMDYRVTYNAIEVENQICENCIHWNDLDFAMNDDTSKGCSEIGTYTYYNFGCNRFEKDQK